MFMFLCIPQNAVLGIYYISEIRSSRTLLYVAIFMPMEELKKLFSHHIIRLPPIHIPLRVYNEFLIKYVSIFQFPI